jgi:transketolase
LRRAFLGQVADMIRNEEDTVFLTVDIGMWAIRDVLKDFPDRCMNVGIYEDGMFSIAAGMASRGLIPTIFGIQPYLIERTLEQIKMDLAYQELGVNVVGTGAAVDYPKYGYSHYCAEDVMIVKAIPGCEFIAPGTAGQFSKLFNEAYRDGKPTFFRISDHPNTQYDVDVSFGKANIMQKGNKATVIAVSIMLDAVMDACRGKDVTVLYYTTLEPFDYEALAANCPSRRLLIAEPEYEGSLLYDVYKALPGQALWVEHVAFPREIFRNYGTYQEKMAYYGLTAEKIREKLASLIENM